MNIKYFRIGPFIIAVNKQYSAIGFCYPRVFVSFPNGEYRNYDLYLGTSFRMWQDEWDSWFDGTEERIDSADEVTKAFDEVGVNEESFIQFLFDTLHKLEEVNA